MGADVIAWLVSLMVVIAPPDKLAAAPQLPGWEETAEQKTQRYTSIATDIHSVVYDPEVKPLYRGKKGRARTAALLLAIAYMESGFAHDVDKGPCYRKGSYRSRCDGGLSAGLWQARIGAGTTLETVHGIDGKTQADLFGDRKLQVRVALHMVRRSFKACRSLGQNALLNVYASGSCFRGEQPAKARLALATRLFDLKPVPADADVAAGFCEERVRSCPVIR